MTDFVYDIDFAFQKNELLLTKEQSEQFERFYQLVVDRNKSFNLTAILDVRDFIIKHFIDSAFLARELPLNCSLCDVGAGAGFPSIPIAILRPDVTVFPMESLEKRVSFLIETKDCLSIKNIQPLLGRGEDFAQKDYRESFDVVTARAVARLSLLSELCIPLVRIGGLFMAMKGADWKEELEEAASAVRILGGGEARALEYSLFDPFCVCEYKRALISVEKTEKTPDAYPRRFAKMMKKPLK